MPTVSIVIRALNEAAHLPALYSGLLRQTRRPDQVILVDSGSTDDSIAISRAHGAEVVHIQPDEFSFGRALNLGCSHASGDILVFVSAHVYPLDEKWLDQMVAPFERREVGLVYGAQTGDSRSHFSELELLRSWFPDVSDDDQQTPFCNNANCAVRAAAWRDLPYDETLTGLEDLDWAKRALEAGWKIVYQADARIAHIHNEPFGVTRNRYRREAIAHRRIFHDQHVNLFEAAGLFALSVGRDYLAAIREAQLGLKRHLDPEVPGRPVPGDLGGIPRPRRDLALAASALLLPEGIHRLEPIVTRVRAEAWRREGTGRVSMSVVAFVPMRHSSERVPGKNYRPFNGEPLFHRIVSTLLSVDRIATVVIDTDSPTVKDQAAAVFPAVQVIDRPEHLLGGQVPMTDVLRYDASQVPSQWYLQTHTTNPLLRASTIDAALDQMEQQAGEHDSLFSVTRLQTRLYWADGSALNHDPQVLLRTQDLAPIYEENSNLYLFTAEQIAAGRRMGDRPILFEIDPLEAVDIDEEPDFVLAEALDRHFASHVRSGTE